MPTADHCRAMAEDAERLASIVSYTRDKVRLREEAQGWRTKAAELDAKAASAEPQAPSAPRLMGWLRRRA
jgi:hypothetical protein